jgi:oligopeptide transport system substrate-binding protein
MIEESQVAFQAFQNGELDILGVAAEDLATVEGDPILSQQVVDLPGSCTSYIGFNTNKAPFDNIKVRQAFAQTFDREAWVRDILKGLGKPTQTFIPEGFPGYEASDKYPFDPAAAKQTLADAGFPNGEGLPEIKLTFSQSARQQARFEWMANQIKQNLGIDVVLDPVDPTAYSALTKDAATTPQMFSLSWCADYPDPQNWVSLWKTGGILQNRLGWSNAKLDELTNAADVGQDQAERLRQYSEAQNILIDEAPVVFINNDAGKMLVRPYVKGITQDVITPLDPAIPGFYGNLQNIEVAP